MLLLHKVDAILIITNIYHSVLMDVHGTNILKNPSFLNYKSNIYVKLQRPQSSHIHFYKYGDHERKCNQRRTSL